MSVPTLTLAQLLQRIVAAVVVLGAHGWAAAVLADRLGDPGPRRDGRATPSSLAHLDVVGFVHALFFQVLWMRPIDVDPAELRGGWRGALAMTAGASFVLVALATALLLVRPFLLPLFGDSASFAVGSIVDATANLAVITAVVHLLPLPPFLGAAWAPWASRLEGVWTGSRLRWASVALLVLVSLLGVTRQGVGPLASAWRTWLGY